MAARRPDETPPELHQLVDRSASRLKIKLSPRCGRTGHDRQAVLAVVRLIGDQDVEVTAVRSRPGRLAIMVTTRRRPTRCEVPP